MTEQQRAAMQQALAFTMREFATVRDFEAARAMVRDALEAALAEPEPQNQSEESLDMVKANRFRSLQSAAYLALDALHGGNHRDAFVILYKELSKPEQSDPPLDEPERKRRTVKKSLTDDGWKRTREYCS